MGVRLKRLMQAVVGWSIAVMYRAGVYAPAGAAADLRFLDLVVVRSAVTAKVYFYRGVENPAVG